MTCPWRALVKARTVALLLLALSSPSVFGDGLAQPAELTGSLPAEVGTALAARRAQLLEQLGGLQAHLSQHNTRCSQIADDDSALIASCNESRQAILAEISAYKTALDSYDNDLVSAQQAAAAAALKTPAPRHYIPSGNALIGGTSWIVGYNVPPEATPALKARAVEMLKQQTELAGIPYNAAVDFQRYNFVLGIGASTDIFTDLRKRVLFDQLSDGKATPALQDAYDSLKGHGFDELACHSNGAMICLAALSNQDITADRVVLYGPQITPESLLMWQQLIRDHKIKSVQIYINQNDPVPPASMLFSVPALVTATSLQGLPLLFHPDSMSRVIHDLTPDIGVKTFSCGGSVPTLDCHDMRVYKEDRGCKGKPSGLAVPGTALPGGRGVLEPPVPC